MCDEPRLKPHEIAEITGWSIGKVFCRLKENKIPAVKTVRKGKLQFLVWPSAFSIYLRRKEVEIGPRERTRLDEKLAEEKAHLERRAHQKMVRKAKSAAKRFDCLQTLRANQKRQYEKVTKQWMTDSPTQGRRAA